jgi:excisionase family DNA binding protein
MDQRLLTTKEVCSYLTISKRTLERLGEDGRGPRRIKISHKRVVYPKDDLDSWIAEREAAPYRAQIKH